MKLSRQFLAVCALLLMCPLARAADAVKFEQIIPVDSWLVVSLENVAESRERWSNTPVGKWWQSEAVQEMVKEELDASRKRRQQRMQKLGVDEDAWSWPSSLGIGFYIVHDDQLDADLPHFLMLGQWSENADKVATIFDGVFNEMQKEDASVVSSVDIGGKQGKVIRVVDKAADLAASKRKRRQGANFVPDDALSHIEALYFVRDGGRFFFGSVKQDIEEAMGVFEGKSRKSVADSIDFQKTLDSVGRGDGWAVLLTSTMNKVSGIGGPQVALIQPFLQTLFGDVRGFGFSLSSQSPGAQFELVSSILVEGERAGLLALPNPSKSATAPPLFVDASATGYGTINVQFNQVMKLIESVASSLPPEMTEQFDDTMQQYGPDLSKAFSKLGPDVHIMKQRIISGFSKEPMVEGDSTTITKNLSTVVAARCPDEQSMTTLLNLFLPEAGFESRDFLGNTIFDTKSRENSFGFGGGWFFIGSSDFVEQKLRSVSKPANENSLAELPACKQALADVGSKPVLCWGYQDILMTVDPPEKKIRDKDVMYTIDSTDAAMANKVGLDINWDPFMKVIGDEKKNWLKALGPSVFTLTQESAGLITRIRVLPPTPQ